MAGLVEEQYPKAEVMRVMMDHRHTYQPAARPEALAPAEAHHLLRTLPCHDTPSTAMGGIGRKASRAC
jgi:hypothetical protein